MLFDKRTDLSKLMKPKKGAWLILAAMIVLVLALLTSVLSPFSPKAYEPSYDSKEVNISPQAIEGYFKANNSEKILAVIFKQLQDNSWMLKIDKPIKIVFVDDIPKYSGFSSSIASSVYADWLIPNKILCRDFGDSCQHYSSDSYYIFLNSKVKSAQPYSKLALVLKGVRQIYDFEPLDENSHNSCDSNIVDAYTWEIKYWQSLSNDQRQHIDGFDDILITREESLREVYSSGNISSYLKDVVTGYCHKKLSKFATSSAILGR